MFLIYLAAMSRAFVQRNAEDMGISRGVRGFGLVVDIVIASIMVLWYLLFQELAFFAWAP